MEYKKQGMSAIVTMMIIIALALVAVGVLWYVYQNVLEGAQEEVEQGATDVFAVFGFHNILLAKMFFKLFKLIS